jgi:hypothetical protein
MNFQPGIAVVMLAKAKDLVRPAPQEKPLPRERNRRQATTKEGKVFCEFETRRSAAKWPRDTSFHERIGEHERASDYKHKSPE